MISNKECRDIAAELRYTANDDLGELSLQKNLAAITKAEDGSWRGVMRRLADLIEPGPERTCMLASTQLTHHAPDGNRYHTCRIVCSECRHDMPEHGESINYCPYCGAKVVG